MTQSPAPVWGDPAAWRNPAPLAGAATADVCVVGLGGSGLAAVGAAPRRGRERGRARRRRRSARARPGATAASCSPGWPASTTTPWRTGAPSARPRCTARRSPSSTAWPRSWARSCGASARSAPRRRTPRRRTARHSTPRWSATASRPSGRATACSSPATDRSSRSRAAARSRSGRSTPAPGCTATPRWSSWPAIACARRPATSAAAPSWCASTAASSGSCPSSRAPCARRGCRCSPRRPSRPAPSAVPHYDNWGYDYWQQLPDGGIALGGGRDRHADWGEPPEPSAAVQAHLEDLLRRRVGVTRADHASLGGRGGLHGGPAAGAAGGPARRHRQRRVLRPRERAGLGRRRARRWRLRSAIRRPSSRDSCGRSIGTDQEGCALR